MRRLRRLPGPERVLLVQAWCLFVLVDVALRVLSFKRLIALGRRAAPASRDESGRRRPVPTSRLVWLVEVAGRYAPVPPTCLTSALVLFWLLRRQGVPVTLRIGVTRQGARLAAHAWLEQDGRPIAGRIGPDGYEPVFSTSTRRGDA